jgi:anti-anti-sigma regulatory factor
VPRLSAAASRLPRPHVTMAVRITSHREEHRFVVSVHGTLDQGAAALLRAEVAQALASPLVLDLSGLMTFDEEGLALLRMIAAGGARLVGASPYVKLRLAPDAATGIRRAPPH